MRKINFAKQKKKLFKNTTDKTSNITETLLDIIRLKLIIKILEFLEK